MHQWHNALTTLFLVCHFPQNLTDFSIIVEREHLFRDVCPGTGLRDAGVSSAASWMVPDHAFSSSGIFSMDMWARALMDHGPWKMRGQASGPTVPG